MGSRSREDHLPCAQISTVMFLRFTLPERLTLSSTWDDFGIYTDIDLANLGDDYDYRLHFGHTDHPGAHGLSSWSYRDCHADSDL